MSLEPPEAAPRASSSSSTGRSLDLPSLQPLSHDHPLLTAKTFNADQFLLSRVYIPLEELRGELREYLGVLREELVQLINDDYEEFISLGTGLRGENERLRRLEKPLAGLRTEIEGVRDVLARHQTAVQSKLDERAALREERALLDLLQRLFETLARAEKLLGTGGGGATGHGAGIEDEDRSKLVARVAGEYTQLVYLTKKASAEGCKIVDTVQPRIDAIRASLSSSLSSILLAHLGDTKALRQTLKTYILIDGQTEAAQVIRTHLRTFCRETIIASALNPASPLIPQTPATPLVLRNPFDPSPRLSMHTPLAQLYNKVLAHVAGYQALMNTSEELSDGESGFGFFEEIVWPEIASAVSENLGSVIFAAGRPDELHKHYTTTYEFIHLLETLAPSTTAVVDMRSSPSYGSFERRWQLPVYFQLRWKEIVNAFEASLNAPSSSKAEPAKSQGVWVLPQSGSAWRAFESCWDEEIFLPELASRFWRLALQVVSRYGAWVKASLDAYPTSDEDAVSEDAALRLASAGMMDFDSFVGKSQEVELLRDMDMQDELYLPSSDLESRILSILTRRSSEPLKLVRSVASQFRAAPTPSSSKTPIQPSHFVPLILKPVRDLFALRPALKEKYGSTWSAQVVDNVCSNYAGLLASVRKTEDLLRRHRKSKKTGFSLFGGGGGAGKEGEGEDEERFVKQMWVDIEKLKLEAEELGVIVDDLAGWRELKEVVERPAE